MHRSAPPPDPIQLAPATEPRLGSLILRCLEKEPASRYPNAVALSVALDEVASGPA